MLRLFLIIVLLLLSVSAFSAKSFSVLDDSPASFFGSGIEGYYFNDGNLSVFFYKNNKLYFSEVSIDNLTAVSDNSDEDVSHIPFQADNLIINKDGTIRLIMSHDSYACAKDKMSNCIFSDILIKSVTVDNIMGKSNVHNPIVNQISKDTTFSLGSKLYNFQLTTKLFNFDDFNDFDATICSKSETGECRTVVFNDILDLSALFELYNVDDDQYDINYEKIDDRLSYIYDFDDMTVTPYETSCLENFTSLDELLTCKMISEKSGVITRSTHKTGINYWRVSYNNEKVNDKFFWINGNKQPFKAYTNSIEKVNFSLFNKVAIEAILKWF